MTFLTDILAALGANFPLVIAACIELLAAAFLVGRALKMHVSGKDAAPHGAPGTLLAAMNRNADEVYLLLRRADTMPVYAVGNVQALLGVSLQRLQEDLQTLGAEFADPHAGADLLQAYFGWDGAAALTRELQLKNKEWVDIAFAHTENAKYDVVTFKRATAVRAKSEQYEAALAKTEEESRSKTTFLSRMSHEIRTPMNGIIGMLTLAEGKLTSASPAMQYLKKADELSAHLLSLINDILDMSRIEAGKVELEERPFSLRALGDKLYDMFAKTLDAHGVHYAVEFENFTADWVIGDELRLSQVIINFLSNAVKFTKQGEIVVTFRQMMQRDGRVDLMIRVHDTGTGMDPAFIGRIFRPFEQEGPDTQRKYGGTGLGMAITDQLVQLMNGQIVVETQPGKGSDFSVYITLPETAAPVQEPAKQAETAPEPDASFRGMRILMAEDNAINAEIATEILGEMGAEVDLAENGQIAVDKVAAKPQDYYDFVLLDVQMPVMDGRTAARTIRAMPRPDAKTLPLFALSADAFVEDERLSAEAGMNGHYAKPVDFVALQRNICAYLREHPKG